MGGWGDEEDEGDEGDEEEIANSRYLVINLSAPLRLCVSQIHILNQQRQFNAML
ncbi:hypothetical protein NIES4103_22590 [Nostoc sp. NIES-4103]|nr:hypothetical protein NIES4103_22590 [Nostoc sp. NIES-4103]